MICKPCSDGADVTRAARLGKPSEVNRHNMLALAASMHSECRGQTWCDCQHVQRQRVTA